MDRGESAAAVAAAMEPDINAGHAWTLYPTAGGTYLDLEEATAAKVTLSALSDRLGAAGHTGTIVQNTSTNQHLWGEASGTRPSPVTAVMAFTVDPSYQDGPFNEYGVVGSRWGVPREVTRACAREWADWVIPEYGPAASYLPGIDLTREDASDVLPLLLDEVRLNHVKVFGKGASETEIRVLHARYFGEVMLTETGTDTSRFTQTRRLLTERVVPHAAHIDYATVRVNPANATPNYWAANGSAGNLWHRWARHLWSQYIPDPNGIQILTDAHLDKAYDLSANWTVTPIVPGRWLVEANDLAPWLVGIDEDAAARHRQYLDPDLLAQARHDFGGAVLTPEISSALEIRGRH